MSTDNNIVPLHRDARRMQTDNELLNVLTREGVLVKAQISIWRGGAKLKPEDLGLDPTKIDKRFVCLGRKNLVKKEALAKLKLIEGRVNAFIEAESFPFLNGLARFVTNAKLDKVRQQVEAFETEFHTERQAFLEGYETLKTDSLAEWRTQAVTMGLPDVERFLATVEAAFPDKDKLEKKFFAFHVHLFQIGVPERLGVDLVNMRDQQDLVAAREAAAVRAAEHIQAEVNEFVRDAVATLREQTATLCQEMLDSINGSETEGGVHQRTLNRLVEFIDHFGSMNFANDRDMARQLESARNTLLSRTAEQYRDDATARAGLVSGLEALRNQARELAKADASDLVRQFGELGQRKLNLEAPVVETTSVAA